MERLAEFDALQEKLSTWCESNNSTYNATSDLKVENIVAVRGVKEGEWVRAKVLKIVSQKYAKNVLFFQSFLVESFMQEIGAFLLGFWLYRVCRD